MKATLDLEAVETREVTRPIGSGLYLHVCRYAAGGENMQIGELPYRPKLGSSEFDV